MKKSLWFGSTLLGVATLWAAPALADESSTFVIPSPAHTSAIPPPPPSDPVVVNPAGRAEGSSRIYRGLTWGGATLLGVSYAAAAISAAIADDACDAQSSMCLRGREVLYVPVVGPFIAMARTEGTGSTSLQALLAMNGAFQVGGVAMAITGLVLSASSMSTPPPVLISKRNLVVSPFATYNSAGLGASGQF